MHQFPENAGALIQVASQFNLLEMTGPEVTPENGVDGNKNADSPSAKPSAKNSP
jgi:hypothetical protein